MARIREDDVNLLLPSFRAVVLELLQRLRQLGYDPVLFDGLRTPEEAAKNAAKGTGSARSIHCYGAAADLICREHLWSCKAAGCKFFVKLGREAKKLGLVWGGDWQKVDQPHVQAIPVSAQAAMRALGRGGDSAPARDALCSKHLKR